MHDCIDALVAHELGKLVSFVNIQHTQDSFRHRVTMPIGKVIDHDDRVTLLLEEITGVRADVTGSTCHENVRHASSVPDA